MKYKAYLQQTGEGCDYTIGCGKRVINIEADSMEEAKQKLTSEILENYGHDESMIDNAELYEINKVFQMPIGAIYDKRDDLKAQETQKQINEADRKDFERLKQKFG